VQVQGGHTFTALKAGGAHTCGLTAGGQVYCWGVNSTGQLGNGSTTSSQAPVLVSGAGFTAISTGETHTCALAGGARCWGDNAAGQLGDGFTANQPAPVPVQNPPASVTVQAGNNQVAAPGAAVATPPAVLVRDALNNPLTGVEVVFAVTGGGGSIPGSTAITASNGIASVASWTLGTTPGTNTLTATVSAGGVIGNPAVFTATGTTGTGPIQWNGNASTDWFDGNNWTPNTPGGPTSTSDVTIPSGTPNYPVLTVNADVHNLTILSGATLGVQGGLFKVFGNLVGGGPIPVSGSGVVQLSGKGKTVVGSIDVLSVHDTAAYTAVGGVATTSLTLNGELIVGGQVVSVQNNLSIFTNGLLVMQNPNDYVFVGGNATFAGAASAGFLTEGVLEVQGTFSQNNTNAASSFSASGNHTTRLVSSVIQPVDFTSPGTGPTLSHFADLDVSSHTSAVDFRLATTVVVEGQLIALPPSGFIQFFTSNGGALSVGGVNVHDLVLNSLPLTIGGGTIAQFDAVTFNFAGAADGAKTQLAINHPGGPSPFIFNGLVFQDQPTTGFYLVTNDVDGTTSGVLTIGLTNPSPATPPCCIQPNNAVINWPATGAIFTWNGSTDTSWSNPANWDRNAVPSVIDDVVVASVPRQPVLTSSVGINNLTIQTGATLDVDTTVLVVGGSLDNAGVINGVAGTGGMVLPGTGKTMNGTVNVDVVIPGSYSLNGSFSALSVAVAGASGSLDLTFNTLTTTNDFSTLNSGTVTMTDPGGQLLVGGSAFFAGGDETGRLTDGLLQISGDFSQIAITSQTSFAPSGTHKTVFTSSTPQLVDFGSPGAGGTGSHFEILDMTGASGGLTLTVNSIVDSTLVAGVAATAPKLLGNGASLTAKQWQVQGMVVDNAPMILNEKGTALPQTFNNVSFTGFPTTATTVSLMDMTAVGSALAVRSVTFNNLTVQTSLGSGGLYAKLVSSNSLGVTLTINGSNDPTGGPSRSDPPFGTTVNGARILWQ
jgi:hypothetical protein